jgi:CO/xanthine dehydrogenase Mo-binding subunit
MEPRGVLAEWDAAQGRMTVLGAAKVPFFNRDTLAAMLGLSPAQVDLIENDVGGGFGARGEFYPEDFLIPFAARLLGRPVRWLAAMVAYIDDFRLMMVIALATLPVLLLLRGTRRRPLTAAADD